MLLDKFEDGKRYRFNKELLSEYRKLIGWKHQTAWEDEIHLHEVTTIDDSCGYIGIYIISPEWCEEIVIEPLKTRDDIKDMYEQLLHLVELEETLESIVGHMIDVELESIYTKFIKCEIERIKQELGLEE